MLFSEKDNLLSLYNALNGTFYTDTEELTITTLKNAVYMNYKNDISFVFNAELMLYEYQATVNPNMPLRNLFYVTSILQGITKDANLYSSVQVKIPAPRFVVFYNGTDIQPEKEILRISDAYVKRSGHQPETGDKHGHPDMELEVTVYNINYGHNSELMEACCLLKEYALYVQKVREYAREMIFQKAVERAVDYCIRNGILTDFLSKNRAEVIAVSIFEYDEEKHIQSEKDLSFQEGLRQGEKLGEERGVKLGEERLNLLNKRLIDEHRMEDLKICITDENYRKKLFTEYNI